MIKVKLFKGMGRGLVTTKSITKGQVLFEVETIPLNRRDTALADKTFLGSYIYCLGRGKSCVALGLGSLFNHAENENVAFKVVFKSGRYFIKYTAVSNIKAGEQLFLNYGYQP